MLSPGQTFARYVIEAPIGEGGMGEVYRAYDDKLRRKVALKVLHPDLAIPDAAARLVREARAAAALAHPNTIAIHDLGEVDGTVFVVMELVSGAPLRAFIGDPSVSVAKKLRWLVDVARGLAAAHKAGIVHRDVKPANIMISDDDVVKVLDFGLAKTVEASSFHTDAGLVVGTPRYLAPELYTGAKADARSDQYAFGVTAYELLSGVHPGGPMGAVPAALDTFVPDVRPGVARVVARTLSRAPQDRFGSMDEVIAALESELEATRTNATSPPVASKPPPTRREGSTADASVALAPTESAPADAPRAPSRVTRPLASDLAPPSRRVGPVFVAAAIGTVGVLYGGYRFLADRDASDPAALAAPEPSASPAEDDALLEMDDGGDTEAEQEADAALGAEPELEAEPEAGVDPGSAATGTWPPRIDDFEDPWLKKKSVDGEDAGR